MWLKEEMKKHYSEVEEEEEAQVTDIQWGNDNFLSDDLMVSCF